jgi:glycosyltransferase involved in cell wall biosynthesis
MKVLHVIQAVSPKFGGPSQALVSMCTALKAAGVHAQIVATDAEPGGRMTLELETPTTYKGVPAIFFRANGKGSFRYSRPLALWLKRNVSDFDVVHIHGVFSQACIAAAKACRQRGIPYVVRPLGHIEPWALAQKPVRKRIFLKLGGELMLRQSNAVHYVSSAEMVASQAALAINHGVVVPLGVEFISPEATDSNAALDGRQRPYVLVLSRLEQTKGIDVFLDAFLTVRRDQHLADWQLIIAGDGSLEFKSRLQKVIKENHAEDAVRLTGWLEGPAKIEALAGASLLALPSHHEAFGLCVVEAMASGVPVLVGPEVGVAADVARGNAGWICEVETNSLVRVLTAALGDSDELRIRGLAGSVLAREFDWTKVAGMLKKLYQDVIDRSGLAASATAPA